MRILVDCSVLINLDNRLGTICTLLIFQKRKNMSDALQGDLLTI